MDLEIKYFQALKKKALQPKILELEMLKYNVKLVRELINKNKLRENNNQEVDKLQFPFIIIEFPSFKNSEVNTNFYFVDKLI